MTRTFRRAMALALAGVIGTAANVSAQIKGVAEVGITQPSTKVVGKEVVTTFKVKNLSKLSIAGLKIDEYWYDKAGNAAPGGSRTLNQPLAPGKVLTIELKTPRTPNMNSNTYQFSHQYGQVTTKVFAKLE